MRIDPRRGGRERLLPLPCLRWTRITAVERSCSKESCRVSKRTGSTEAVQNITNQEAGVSGVGRQAEEIPYSTFEGPIASQRRQTPGRHGRTRDATICISYRSATMQNLSDLAFDLSRSLKVKLYSAIGLPIYGFLLMFNSNMGLTRLLYEL